MAGFRQTIHSSRCADLPGRDRAAGRDVAFRRWKKQMPAPESLRSARAATRHLGSGPEFRIGVTIRPASSCSRNSASRAGSSRPAPSLPDRQLRRLPPPHPCGAPLHRRGLGLRQRARQQPYPAPSRPVRPLLDGRLAPPGNGRAAPPPPPPSRRAGKLLALSTSCSIYLRLSISRHQRRGGL